MNEKTSFADFEKGKKGAETKKRRGAVKSMTIRKADNGFISKAEHEDNGDGKMGMYQPTMQTEKVHPDAHALASHVSQMFGGKQMVPGTPEAEEESEAAGAGDPNEGAEKEPKGKEKKK